jgi:hypothetical protein
MTAAVTWTREPVVIGTGEGPITTEDGWISSAEPNLAVTNRGALWGVTHIASGMSIGTWFVTRGAAEALLLAIAPLTDWSQDAPQLRELEALSVDVWRIRASIYEREYEGEFGHVDKDLIRTLNREGTRLEEVQHTRLLGEKARARREGGRRE